MTGTFENAALLIVDDEPFLRELLAARLAVFGAKILQAENGQQALEIMHTQTIDAVLTDIDMPVMNGLELLGRIRELGWLTPVVILTGMGDQTTTLTALRLGATDFLDKPFDSKVIREVMTKALEIGTASRRIEKKLKDSQGDGQTEASPQISLDDFRRWKSAMSTALAGNAAAAEPEAASPAADAAIPKKKA